MANDLKLLHKAGDEIQASMIETLLSDHQITCIKKYYQQDGYSKTLGVYNSQQTIELYVHRSVYTEAVRLVATLEANASQDDLRADAELKHAGSKHNSRSKLFRRLILGFIVVQLVVIAFLQLMT